MKTLEQYFKAFLNLNEFYFGLVLSLKRSDMRRSLICFCTIMLKIVFFIDFILFLIHARAALIDSAD